MTAPSFAPVRFTPLSTDRLLLRPTEPGDLDPMATMLADPPTCRYLPHPPLTRAEVAAKISAAAGRVTLVADDDLVRVASRLRSDDGTEGDFVGELILRVSSAAGLAVEVGWVLSPGRSGSGYATEAARALVGFALGPLAAHRVIARLHPDNTASAAVCTRLGMRQESWRRGDYWVDGVWEDTLEFAILDQEWAQRSPA